MKQAAHDLLALRLASCTEVPPTIPDSDAAVGLIEKGLAPGGRFAHSA
ncbi:MAG TPA: hypothetical protein VF736_21950 [Pyrinomonadaceae bacterium]